MAQLITVYDLKLKRKREINVSNIETYVMELLSPDIISKVTMNDGEIIYTRETPTDLKDLIDS